MAENHYRQRNENKTQKQPTKLYPSNELFVRPEEQCTNKQTAQRVV